MKKLLTLIGASCAVLSGMSQTPASHLDLLYPNTFNPQDVTLHDGRFRDAMMKNIEVLKAYDVDRLLAPFYIEAGLEPKAAPFENWAGLDGHIAGHYLSALAIHYAATGDQQLLDIINYMLDEMAAIQKANGDGYVGGVPQSKQCWNDVRNGDVSAVSKRWVPWYNMHKVYAGLRDAYIYAGSQQALDQFLALCEWGLEVISHLDDEQMETMVGSEFGGMNEVLADAYNLTGDERYLDAAIRFSHHWLLDSMAAGVDNLDNHHANTQVPKAVGYQRVAEMCAKAGRDDLARTYADAADFFWHTVADTRSLAIGGNSRREYFPSAADCVSYTEEREGPESCNTNNMMKLTEGLFRMDPDSHYADFYERAMFNHILSTQHPEHGGYVYFTSARPGHYRVYSQPNSAMWCCVGTGMENHGKYSQFIYSHDGDDKVSVNLFVPSTLRWGDVTLTQNTAFPDAESSSIMVSCPEPSNFTMRVRKPQWCDDFAMKINGKDIHSYSPVDGYIEITRTWSDGDVVDLSLPMAVTLEEMPNVPDYVAIMRGPIVLGARISTDDLAGLVADDSRWGHIAHGRLFASSEVPSLIGERDDILAKLNAMKRLPGGKPRYKVDGLFDGQFSNLVLEPFSDIHDSRYMMYWLTMSSAQLEEAQALRQALEAERLRIDGLTVDAVNFGEQQPEVDHRMKQEHSEAGNYQGQSYRHAENGWFSCELETGGRSDLSLLATYWGNESGNRKFDILIDGEVLTQCDNNRLTGKSEFVDVAYDIPESMLKGKDIITVTYRALPGNYAGGLYNLRLLRSDK